jgi:enterochelin esterase-like enzyme
MRAAVLALAAALLLPLLPSPARAQVPHGVVKEGLMVTSRILGKKVRYTIYLPPDYETSSRAYPVVYLLHGYTDDDTGWLQFGEADRLADRAIADGTIPPMILVMPDAGVSWYIDNFDGSVRYEDFFFREFIPYVESHYRIRAEKRYRGVAGLSMGGFGSLVYGLHHPEMFAALAGFSSAVYTDPEKIEEDDRSWAQVDSVLYGPAKGAARINPTFTRNSPLHFLKDADLEKIRTVRIYLDVGDDDFLYRGNAALHVLLRDLKVPHEYRVRDGAHNWTYWRTGLIDGLKFIGGSFHQE